MSWRERVARFRGTLGRRRFEREMDEEMRFHVDMATERNVRAGHSPKEARRRALVAFGPAEAFKEEGRAALRARSLEDRLADVRVAVRSLLRTPAFTFVAAATLALGVGGTATAYAALRVLLVDALPFRSSGELVLVRGRNALRGPDVLPASHPDFRDWRESPVFQELAAWTSYPGSTAALSEGAGAPEEIQLAYVSENLFRTLGVDAHVGHAFLPEDGSAGSEPTVVLAHSLWERRFAADPDVVGAAVSVEGRSYVVRGVLPPTFRFAAYPRDAELYVSLAHEPNAARQQSRVTRYLGVVGRLSAGVDAPAAARELAGIAARIEAEEAVNEGYTVEVAPLRQVLLGDRKAALTLLFGGSLVLLLVATVNVASLFLARAASRTRELALRHALGGTRRRLAGLFWTESAVLGVAGGGAGVLLAFLGSALLTPFLQRAPSYLVPFDLAGQGVHVDWTAAFVALGVALGAGTLAALSTLPRIHQGLAQVAGSGPSRATESLRAVVGRRRLVALETALTTALLIAAGLLGRSLWALRVTDPGFESNELFAADVRLSPARYADPGSADRFWDAVLGGLGGAGSAAAVELLPLRGGDQSTGLLVEGLEAARSAERPQVHHRIASEGYFRLMSIPVVSGREFQAGDSDGDARVAIVNATLARRLFPDDDALGGRVALDFEALVYRRDEPPAVDLDRGYRTIVGVVGDVHSLALDEEPRPELYTPTAGASARMLTLVFRSPAGSAVQLVQAAVSDVDPGQPVGRVVSVSQVVSASVAAPTSRATLLGAFAATTLLLAAVGIYGTISFSVSRRRRDLGIRMALGASGSDVRRRILAEAVAPVLVGILPGVFGGWLAARALRDLLYDISPLDPWTFAAVPLFLLMVGVVAGLAPAHRAAASDPAEVLKSY